jgi:hypothetical protein
MDVFTFLGLESEGMVWGKGEQVFKVSRVHVQGRTADGGPLRHTTVTPSRSRSPHLIVTFKLGLDTPDVPPLPAPTSRSVYCISIFCRT